MLGLTIRERPQRTASRRHGNRPPITVIRAINPIHPASLLEIRGLRVEPIGSNRLDDAWFDPYSVLCGFPGNRSRSTAPAAIGTRGCFALRTCAVSGINPNPPPALRKRGATPESISYVLAPLSGSHHHRRPALRTGRRRLCGPHDVIAWCQSGFLLTES